MFSSGNRGTVLVASLIILALLSLLGAGSLMNASLDTQLATNQSMANEAFYAAEAGLDAGVGEIYETVTSNLRPYDPASQTPPTNTWVSPTVPAAMTFADVNGYTVEYRINYVGATWPGGGPRPYQFSQLHTGQVLESDAYTYLVEGRATSNSGDGTVEQMSETLQVLETPLVQYFVFFDDDLGWHHGNLMTSWGRIHTNGDLGFGNTVDFTFNNYDGANNGTPNVITASGIIRYGGHLQQDGTWDTRLPSATSAVVDIRVNNLATIPSASGADYVEIDTTIDATTQAAQEARFVDADGEGHVRVGVDTMPAASLASVVRGGFYETEANDPAKPNVDGMVILSDGGLSIWFQPFDGPGQWVTALVNDYEVASGVAADLAGWSAGARINADGSNAPATAPAAGGIVYAPEAIVATLDGGAGGPFTTARVAGTSNPDFPCVLEEQDDREGMEVDLLVIDLQRLQEWYRDYLDQRDGGGLDDSIDLTIGDRSLLIYASRTPSTGFVAGTTPLQAVKLIGSSSGRVRSADVSQQSPTLRVRTTLVTDNPLYLDGDFNAPGMNGGDASPGSVGCALLGDALTLLSREWGNDVGHLGVTGGAVATTEANTATAFNAAFFVGRYDFRNFPTTDEEAGIHNFPHFLENWNPGPQTDCNITGCLINLWFSLQSEGPHSTSYYGAPGRNFGWDQQFANRSYWPPYVPSIYSVERVAWRED